MRSDEWLQLRFNQIWEKLFSDVERRNNVLIRFKGNWKNKFGHIKRLKNKDTEIGINNLFRYEKVPEFIIDLTIAHELIHYSHGFQSPHEKKFSYPHQGGVVNKELKQRGLGLALKKEKEWVKRDWVLILKEIMPSKLRRRRRSFKFSFF